MRIYVKAVPRAGKNEVTKIGDAEYKVKVTDPPEKGKANERVIELLAYHLKVPKNSVKIIAGRSTRTKLVDIG
jgi:uncharacterized protein